MNCHGYLNWIQLVLRQSLVDRFDEVKLCWLIVLRVHNQLYCLLCMSSILQLLDSANSSIPIAPPLPPRRRRSTALSPPHCITAVSLPRCGGTPLQNCIATVPLPPVPTISFHFFPYPRFPMINSLIFQLMFQLKLSRFISYLPLFSPHSIPFPCFIVIVYHSTYWKIISMKGPPMTTTCRFSFIE